MIELVGWRNRWELNTIKVGCFVEPHGYLTTVQSISPKFVPAASSFRSTYPVAQRKPHAAMGEHPRTSAVLCFDCWKPG